VQEAFAKAARRTSTTIKKLPATTRPRRRASKTIWTVPRLLEAYKDPRAVLLEIASTETLDLAKTLAGATQRGPTSEAASQNQFRFSFVRPAPMC
jgi:hypothetical protein